MGKALILIRNEADRQKAATWAFRAPPGTAIAFQGPTRSRAENARMWALLSILAHKLVWHGQRYSPSQWKDYFMHQLRGGAWMPDEAGGMVPIGRSTGELKAEEHRELVGLIQAFAARQGVDFDNP